VKSGLIFWSLVIPILAAPLPFGSVSEWAWGPQVIIAAFVLAAWILFVVTGGLTVTVGLKQIAIPAVLFGVTIVWILIQLAPFTPASWHHPVWREAATALGTTAGSRITVDPDRSAAGIARLLWYATVFWLALQLGRDRVIARRSIWLVSVAAAAYAAYGLAVHLGGTETVLWTKKNVYLGSLTSTFVNKNSYAAFAGLGLICLTSLLAERLIERSTEGETSGGRFALLANELIAKGWPLLVGWFLVATALILANSRAGLASGIIGLIALIMAIAASRSVSSRFSKWFAGITVGAILIFVIVSGGQVLHRFDKTIEAAGSRIALYELTLRAIDDSPMLGMGYGTFPRVFELYRVPVLTASIYEARHTAQKAHNTYLENALELGIPVATALTLSVVWFVGACILGIRRRRRDSMYAAVGIAASVLVGIHSIFDFSLQIPAICVTYFFLLGIACAQSWSTHKSKDGFAR